MTDEIMKKIHDAFIAEMSKEDKFTERELALIDAYYIVERILRDED